MSASLRLSTAVEGLPISVRALASSQGLSAPISLRALLAKAGQRVKVVRIGVLRYQFQTPLMTPVPSLWQDQFYDALFNGRNGWSLHDYWSRATLGRFDLEFDIRPWKTLAVKQADIKDDRGRISGAVRDAAAADGVAVDTYAHTIAFVHPPPTNAGATGSPGDAVFDQGGSIPFFQHELGHMIGLRHAFGPTCGDFLDGYVYHDDYCVMGFTGNQGHALARPIEATGSTITGGGFFNSERRPAAATLYRYLESDIHSASSFVKRDLSQPFEATLVALSEARIHDPILVVVSTSLGDVTFEYRTAVEDDAGVGPGVVVHSLGRRRVMENNGEDRPVWYEAVVPATHDTERSQAGDIRIKVLNDGGTRIRIKIDKPPAS